VLGPDLTHVGGRQTLAAGTLPNDQPAFLRWLTHTDTLKPAVRMPAFGMLKESELDALSAYLESLQ
jgi:cytochrome c oxidase subunit 2